VVVSHPPVVDRTASAAVGRVAASVVAASAAAASFQVVAPVAYSSSPIVVRTIQQVTVAVAVPAAFEPVPVEFEMRLPTLQNSVAVGAVAAAAAAGAVGLEDKLHYCLRQQMKKQDYIAAVAAVVGSAVTA